MTDPIQPDRHTVSAFDAELSELRVVLARMGGLAELALDKALAALDRLDTASAQEVVAEDRQIDALEAEVNQRVIGLIVRRAPMADDLREVLAGHRMAGQIERVGDYAKTIAKRVAKLEPHTAEASVRMLLDLSEGVRAMLRDALNAFAARDAAAAEQICVRDQKIDDLYNSLFLALLAEMMRDPQSIPTISHLLFVAKSLERVGDQATNIAELVYFALTSNELQTRHTRG